MQKTYLIVFLLVPFLLTQKSIAQTCARQIEVAEKYLKQYDRPSEDLILEISSSVDSCYSSSASSRYVEGMINLFKIQPNPKKAFDLFKSSAEEKHADAACMLGILYKEGNGCAMDFEKAVSWFTKASELGSSKATYSLGYMYFKGFGTAKQDYEKAVEFFNRSNYPMAKHWLAICKKYGLGVVKDEDSAFDLLDENELSNSKFLKDRWLSNPSENVKKFHSQTVDGESNLLEESFLDNLDEIESNLNEFSLSYGITGKSGQYKGRVLEMDWSYRTILAASDLNLDIAYDQKKDSFDLTLKTGDSTVSRSQGNYDEYGIYPYSLGFSLPYLYADRDPLDFLDLQINSLSLTEQTINSQEYLVMNVDAWSNNLNEPAPPMFFIVSQDPFALTREELQALALQKANFIKLFPNPFEEQLLIQYDLENGTTCAIMLYNIKGMPIKPILKETYQEKGKQTLRIETGDLPLGQYVLKLVTDRNTYTKIAIKK